MRVELRCLLSELKNDEIGARVEADSFLSRVVDFYLSDLKERNERKIAELKRESKEKLADYRRELDKYLAKSAEKMSC